MSGGPVLIALAPSGPRRWSGIGALAVLGLLLFWVVATSDIALPWNLLYIGLGLLALWGAMVMHRATGERLELTETELRTSSGRVLTPIANIRAVERGAFAFKPSNGFLLRLKEPAGRGWAPGLWWQRGTFLGVGGVINGGQSRAMAEAITALTMGVVPETRAR